MAVTTPDEIRTPNAGDTYALTQDLLALADTIQEALFRRGYLVGTNAQRLAYPSPSDGVRWFTTDTGIEWHRLSGTWVRKGGTKLLRTTAYNFPTGEEGPIAWNAAGPSTGEFTNSSGVLTCNIPGEYRIFGQASLDGGSVVQAYLVLRKNGASLAQAAAGRQATISSLQVGTIESFALGDTLQLNVSASGTALPANVSSGRNYILIDRIG